MNQNQTNQRFNHYIESESTGMRAKEEKLHTVKALAPQGMVPYPLFTGFSPFIWIYNRFIAPKVKFSRSRDKLLQLKME